MLPCQDVNFYKSVVHDQEIISYWWGRELKINSRYRKQAVGHLHLERYRKRWQKTIGMR
jgi:predicted transcriptional regulator